MDELHVQQTECAFMPCLHPHFLANFLGTPQAEGRITIPVTLARKFILRFRARHVGQVTMASAEISQCLFMTIPPQMTG